MGLIPNLMFCALACMNFYAPLSIKINLYITKTLPSTLLYTPSITCRPSFDQAVGLVGFTNLSDQLNKIFYRNLILVGAYCQ